jgi:hypothetical protein
MPPLHTIIRLLLLPLLLALPACGKKSDPESGAREFFDLLRAGRTKDAYESTAFTFQTRQALKGFDADARDAGLIGARDLSLKMRGEKPSSALFDGAVTTPAGARLEFDLKMTNEAGAWRVAKLQTLSSGPERAPQNRFTLVGKQARINQDMGRDTPPQDQIKALTRDSISEFSQGLVAKDFESFYGYISQKWRDQVSKVRLYRAFEPFIENGIDFSDVRDMEPVFDTPPFINPDGLLVVRGYYPTAPNQKRFDLTFIYELPKWRLFGINVQVVAAPDPQPQPEASAPQGGDPGLQ